MNLYDYIIFHLNTFLSSLASIGTIEPGIGIDAGNQLVLYALVLSLIIIGNAIRQFDPYFKIQFEQIRVKDRGITKYCVIDINDPLGHNLRKYFLYCNDVTKHYVLWDGKVWYAVMAKEITFSFLPRGIRPYFSPEEFSPTMLRNMSLGMNDNNIRPNQALFTNTFPAPNMWVYYYLYFNHTMQTVNGFNDDQVFIEPVPVL